MSAGRTVAAAALLLNACRARPASPPPTAPPGPLTGWHYRVALDEGLTTAEINICFDGLPPQFLVPGRTDAGKWLTHASAEGGKPLRRTRKHVDLAGLPPGSCVDMSLDLLEMAPTGGSSRVARRVGNSVLARPSAWMWRPAVRPKNADVTVTFEMPAASRVSVPWPTEPGSPRDSSATYVLDDTAFDWLAYALWGEIDVLHIGHAGAEIEVATLDQPIACTRPELERWLKDTTEIVAGAFGGSFPREQLQLVLVPVGAHGGTVDFGMAARGGGSAVFVLLDSGARGPDLMGTWTTVHEMLHHGMPFIQEPWMAEGWVTYYTDVLRARHGNMTEEAAWARMAAGFARGDRGGRGITLRATSAAMHETYAYQRVYWGGAALALLTDVAIREDSGGTVTLDDALVELRRCCGETPKRWPADALLSHLDAWYGKPLFTEVAERELSRTTFPAVAEVLERLGVEVDDDGHVHLDDAHPGAALRRAIMQPRDDPQPR